MKTDLQSPDDLPFRADEKAKRLALLFLGGLLIGLAASLPLAVGWQDAMRPPVGVCLSGTESNPFERVWFRGRTFSLPCLPTFLFIQPAVAVSFLGAGIVFGLMAGDLAGWRSVRSARLRMAALGGFSLLLLVILGMLAVPRIPGPELPVPFSSGVAEPFAIMTFGIAFLFALILGLALRTPAAFWRALGAAAPAALLHWFVTWLFLGRAVTIWTHDITTPPLADSLPSLGNGMGPMLTTILISNLVAGTLGGWVTLALLTHRHSPVHEGSDSQVSIPGTAGVE